MPLGKWPFVSNHAGTVLLVWLFMVFFLLVQPIDDFDLFWQVQLGSLMLDQHHLITLDPFTYTHDGQPVPTVGWLAQLIFAGLYRLGSWPTVQFLHVLLFATAFILPRAGSRREEAGPFSMAAGLFLGFLVALPHSSVRPQSFAVAGFAGMLAIVQSKLRTRYKMVALTPILLIWQNAHPSLTVGAAALMALAGARTINWLRDRKRGKAWPLLVLFLMPVLFQLATPMGWSIFKTLETNQAISSNLMGVGVSEWRRGWDPSVPGIWLFWVALALSLGLLVWLRFDVSLEDLLLFSVMTLLSLTWIRMALFWAVAMVPLWAHWIERVRPEEIFNWNGARCWTGWGPTLVCTACAAFVLPFLVRGSIISDEVPMDGIRKLKEKLPQGRVYNYREWGGPLIMEGYPNWKVALDGRLYLYTPDEWDSYHNAARAMTSLNVSALDTKALSSPLLKELAEIQARQEQLDENPFYRFLAGPLLGDRIRRQLARAVLDDLVRRHQPDAFFLRHSFHKELIWVLMLFDEDWQAVHSDKLCVVFVRRR